MDWANNIPQTKDRPAKRKGGFPSFLELIGWGFIAFICWILWAAFSPPIIASMFGPIIIFLVVIGVSFLVAGLILRTIWRIITWPFRRGE